MVMESRRSMQWSHKFPSLIQPNFFQCHCCHRHTICFFSCRFGVTSARSGRFSPPTRTSSNITFEYFMRGYSSELELWRWQSKWHLSKVLESFEIYDHRAIDACFWSKREKDVATSLNRRDISFSSRCNLCSLSNDIRISAFIDDKELLLVHLYREIYFIRNKKYLEQISRR